MSTASRSDAHSDYSMDDVNAIWEGYIHEGVKQDLTDTLGKLTVVSKVGTVWNGDAQEHGATEQHSTVWDGGNGKLVDNDEQSTAWENGDDGRIASSHEVFGFDIYQEFKLLERIGEGAMGMVFRAYQSSFDRDVVIKMIKPEFACDDGARSKFISEARVTGKLNHPNVVPVYELSHVDDILLFYAMKQVEGIPWNTLFHKTCEADNLEILLKVCDAVSFAHSKGILHRDLKPENIILGDYGEVFVMDWGLAVSFYQNDKIERLTPRTGVGGTPAYMAPEMARRENHRIGPCSDIYLLGGILYEIVTGLKPHSGSTVPDCILAAMNNRIQPTDRHGELVDIALTALATTPEERYKSVKHFQRKIRHYQSHSESILLTAHAQEDFDRAKATNVYDDYVHSMFGFHNALKIWPDNPTAQEGLSAVGLAYAQCAYEKGDYELALSHLDPHVSSHLELLKQIEPIRRNQQRQEKRRVFLKYGILLLLAFCAGMLLLLLILWGLRR